MSDSHVLDIYLREIGVKTPVSLLFCTPDRFSDSEIDAPDMGIMMVKDLPTLAMQALACKQCVLSETRSDVMFGSGCEDADVLLVGDVPHGESEQGDMFTGDPSLLLDNILKAIGLQREQVYIAHIIQCPTPEHRDPNADEWKACQPWLQQKIKVIKPKVILFMGRVAAQTLLQCDDALHDLRGQWHGYQDVPVRVIYHPAYLLRSPRQKDEMWKDLQLIQARLSSL